MNVSRARSITVTVTLLLLAMAAVLCVKYSHHPVHPDPGVGPVGITQPVQAPVDTPKVSHYVAPKPSHKPKAHKAAAKPKHHKAAKKAKQPTPKWTCHTKGGTVTCTAH